MKTKVWNINGIRTAQDEIDAGGWVTIRHCKYITNARNSNEVTRESGSQDI